MTAALPISFPFAAITGQPQLRLALLLAAIDTGLGGVLIEGPRGTAKSTAARALAELLPGSPFVTLPLGASLEHLVGTLDLGRALAGHEAKFAPGLLARAHGGVLYVDEVNLLPDALIDSLLDAAASGVNAVEREGISHRHAARFVLVGTMNPEEGELRPQLLDRFGLSVALDNPRDAGLRQSILRARLAFDEDPQALLAEHAPALAHLREQVATARSALAGLAWSDAVLAHATQASLTASVDGMRADLVMLRAARALAALEGRDAVTTGDVDAVVEFALAHRRSEAPAPRPSSQPAPASGSPSTSRPLTQADGDWGALPPEPVGTTRVASTGAWPPKKA